MTSQQPRQPAGVPSGGQYAAEPRERSGISLGDDGNGGILVDMATATNDDDYNATGSYAHPPIARSAAQVIKFWITAKIPDHVLDQVAEAYAERNRGRRGVAEVNPAHKGFRRSTREANAELARVAGRQPNDSIPPHQLADVVRLGCMYRQATEMPPEQAERVADASFVLNARTDRMSPAQAWEHFELGEIEYAFIDSRERDLESKHDLQTWNLYQGINRIGNLVGPDGNQRPPEYLPYGAATD